MLWVQKMNYIRNRVTEIVNKEIIYLQSVQSCSWSRATEIPL